jgi:ABC-2 type transport system permease protein
MNKLFLKFAMLPAPFWRSLGADTDQLSAILNMRLMIDNRRPMGFGRRQTQKKEIKHGTITSTLLFTLMGAFYSLPLFAISDRIISLALYFTIIFLMLTLSLITDFSNALFDNKDKYTLFPRPINDRTLVLAKLLHIFIYLLRMVVPTSLAAWCLLIYQDGWTSAIIFPIAITLLTFMSLFVVNGVYLIILRLTNPERFKDIISYFQVVASVIFFAIVYLRPRNVNIDVEALSPTDFSWAKYVPSYWLASFWHWLGHPMLLGGGIAVTLLGLLTPVICIVALVRWLAPEFTKKINGIDGAEVSMPVAVAAKGSIPNKFYLRMANLFNRNEAAKAGFILAWLQTSRSRTFRMRVYPSMAFIPIYFIYLLTQNGSSIADAFGALSGSKKYLLLLYMSSYVLINGLNYLVMSDQYKAAWVFYSSPVDPPGHIMIGAFKALCVKLFLPFFIAITAFILYIWGVSVVPDILLAMINVLVLAICMARISLRQLPFSSMEQMKQSGGRVIKSLLTMLIPAVLGFAHYLSIHIWWLKLTLGFLSAAMLWFIWESYATTTWANVRKEDV